MLIRKTQQPAEYPDNTIHDAYTESSTDTYSCNYVNNITDVKDLITIPVCRGIYNVLFGRYYTENNSKTAFGTVYNFKEQLLAVCPISSKFKRKYLLQALVNTSSNGADIYIGDDLVMDASVWGANATFDYRVHTADITDIINNMSEGHKTLSVNARGGWCSIGFMTIMIMDELIVE